MTSSMGGCWRAQRIRHVCVVRLVSRFAGDVRLRHAPLGLKPEAGHRSGGSGAPFDWGSAKAALRRAKLPARSPKKVPACTAMTRRWAPIEACIRLGL